MDGTIQILLFCQLDSSIGFNVKADGEVDQSPALAWLFMMCC